ncbi:MAG: flagellar hook-associated protein FlgK [Armatimonadota bacterium]|nr:flagellar hook-associated protein FlgK [Armatimonadota bacterium]
MSLRLINIAKTALYSQRAALEVVGHNVANVETDGYVRQRPVMAPIPGAVTGEAGGGVEIVDIELLRDEFLATQVRYESGCLGRERALRASLLQVEQIFTDVTQGGVAQRLEEMFDAWADLGLNPTSAACRTQVVERSRIAARTIADRWQAMADLRVEIDQRLRNLVGRANSLAHEVAKINEKISATPSFSTRNDLQTRLDALTSQLAELCGAEVIQQENGIVDVLIGGRRFVEHHRVNELELAGDPAQPGMHLVKLGSEVSPHGLRGEIAGRLQARDEFIPQYLQRLDTLAQTLADEVNAQHAAGLDLSGNPAPELFEYDPTRPAASLRVRDEIVSDPSLIGAAQSTVVESDGTNALAIEDLRNTRLLSGGTATLSQYAAELISLVGIEAEAAQVRFDSRDSLVQNLQDAQMDRSGVSLDEEALELIRYQQAYAAAGRLMSVALEIMDLVVELG